jgi:hypothetical protein
MKLVFGGLAGTRLHRAMPRIAKRIFVGFNDGVRGIRGIPAYRDRLIALDFVMVHNKLALHRRHSNGGCRRTCLKAFQLG